MADKHVKVEISAVDRASQVFRGMGREADALKKRLSGLRGGFGGLLSGMGAGALGALGGGLAFSSVIGQAADFETALYETTKVTSRSTEDIKRQMLSLPSSLGSVTELTTGYYQVLSAGISDVAKSQETLTTASKLAKVAGVSQAESIQALTKMMAGYRGELKSTAQAADLLLDIEEYGQASVRELVPIIGDLAGVSQIASVRYKEMAASLSLLTQTAGNPARASTQYRALMMELLKPNEQMLKLINAVGAKSGTELIKKNGLIGGLALLQKAAKASNAEMSKFIGSSEALLAFASLADNGFRRLYEILTQVGIKTGRTDESFKKFLGTFRGVEDQGRATFTNLAVAFGEGFLPVVKEGLTDFNGFLEANTGRVGEWGRSAAESLTSVTRAVGGVVDLWQQVPDSLEYGVVGALLFGKKGLLLGLMIEVADTLHTMEQGIKAFSDGTISFGEWATSNRAELKGLLKSRNWRDGGGRDGEALSFAGGASQAGVWRSIKENEAARAAASAQTQATVLRGLIRDALPSTSVTASGLPAGKTALTLDKPVLTLEHPVLDMGRDFAKELTANLPAPAKASGGPELPELQPGFKPVSTGGKKKSGKSETEKAAERAWKASDALREMDLTIARLAGDSETVKRLELQDTIADWEKKFSDLKVPADVAREKIEQLTEASRKSTRIKDAQAAAQFYKELAEAAGDFGAAQEYTNQLIELQAENLRQSVGVSDELIAKWVELQKLQNSRDLFDGAKRGAMRFADEYGDVAKQVENLTYGIGSTIATTLSDAFMTGEFSAQKFFTSLVSLASQAMANVLVGKLMGGIFGGVSLFHNGGEVGISPTTTRSVPTAAFALAPRFHDGGGLFAADEYPAILKRGERVLNPAETRAFHAGARMAGGGMGGDVVLNVRPVLINETGTPMTAKTSASYDGKGGFDIEILVTQLDTALARRDASGRSVFGNQMDKTRGLSRSRSLY